MKKLLKEENLDKYFLCIVSFNKAFLHVLKPNAKWQKCILIFQKQATLRLNQISVTTCVFI